MNIKSTDFFLFNCQFIKILVKCTFFHGLLSQIHKFIITDISSMKQGAISTIVLLLSSLPSCTTFQQMQDTWHEISCTQIPQDQCRFFVYWADNIRLSWRCHTSWKCEATWYLWYRWLNLGSTEQRTCKYWVNERNSLMSISRNTNWKYILFTCMLVILSVKWLIMYH